jgi:hypothetical protein
VSSSNMAAAAGARTVLPAVAVAGDRGAPRGMTANLVNVAAVEGERVELGVSVVRRRVERRRVRHPPSNRGCRRILVQGDGQITSA